MTTRYTTASGSIYEVAFAMGIVEHEYRVRRRKLGEHHSDRQVARRNADALGGGEWVKVREVQHHGTNFPLVINFDDPEKDLVTAPVVKIEEIA